jgi:hypothetical protein
MNQISHPFLRWLAFQVEQHFADICLMILIFALLCVVLTHGAYLRWVGEKPEPENLAWARELISAITGCLLGRLATIGPQGPVGPQGATGASGKYDSTGREEK